MLAAKERLMAELNSGFFQQARGRAGLFALRRGYYALFQPLQRTVRV